MGAEADGSSPPPAVVEGQASHRHMICLGSLRGSSRPAQPVLPRAFSDEHEMDSLLRVSEGFEAEQPCTESLGPTGLVKVHSHRITRSASFEKT